MRRNMISIWSYYRTEEVKLQLTKQITVLRRIEKMAFGSLPFAADGRLTQYGGKVAERRLGKLMQYLLIINSRSTAMTHYQDKQWQTN